MLGTFRYNLVGIKFLACTKIQVNWYRICWVTWFGTTPQKNHGKKLNRHRLLRYSSLCLNPSRPTPNDGTKQWLWTKHMQYACINMMTCWVSTDMSGIYISFWIVWGIRQPTEYYMEKYIITDRHAKKTWKLITQCIQKSWTLQRLKFQSKEVFFIIQKLCHCRH